MTACFTVWWSLPPNRFLTEEALHGDHATPMHAKSVFANNPRWVALVANPPSIMPTMPQRVLLIGCGFVGSHLVEAIDRAGHRPIVLTRSKPDQDVASLLDGSDLHLGDAGDRSVLEAAVAGVDHVMFSANGLMPPEAEVEPMRDLELSLRPLLTLLDVIASMPDVGLTFVSSGGTVYGIPQHVPIAEGHPTDPIGAYGISKLAAEKHVLAMGARTGHPVRILRCANVYGPRQPATRSQGAVAIFLRLLSEGRPIRLFGAGEQVRDFVFAADLANAAVDLIDAEDRAPVVNIGSGEGTSMLALVNLLGEVAGLTPRVEHLPVRSFDIPVSVLDISLLSRLIDYQPRPIREGLRLTWNWMVGTSHGGAPR